MGLIIEGDQNQILLVEVFLRRLISQVWRLEHSASRFLTFSHLSLSDRKLTRIVFSFSTFSFVSIVMLFFFIIQFKLFSLSSKSFLNFILITYSHNISFSYFTTVWSSNSSIIWLALRVILSSQILIIQRMRGSSVLEGSVHLAREVGANCLMIRNQWKRLGERLRSGVAWQQS